MKDLIFFLNHVNLIMDRSKVVEFYSRSIGKQNFLREFKIPFLERKEFFDREEGDRISRPPLLNKNAIRVRAVQFNRF